MKEIKVKNEWFSDISLYEIVFILPVLLKSEMRFLEKAISFTINENRQFSTDVTVKFELGTDTSLYEDLRKWYEIIYDSHSGFMNTKSDYIGVIIITQHDRVGCVIRRFTLHGSQLISLNNDSTTIEANFVADYWLDDYTGVIPPMKTKEKVDMKYKFLQERYPNVNMCNCTDAEKDKMISNIELTKTNLDKAKFFIKNETGYHLSDIKRGELGEISKIEEELNELKDAEKQGSKVMMMIELSDLYGAIEEYCIKNNLTMEDLKSFSDITKRAFKNGHRK